MSSSLSDLGQQLKIKRKELNLSIKEVESSTSIRGNYITAIEDGNVEDLLSPVYIHGFIKQYASFLGLDAESFISKAKDSFKTNTNDHPFYYGIGPVERRNSMGGIRWVPILKWSLTLSFILISLYMFAKYMDVI